MNHTKTTGNVRMYVPVCTPVLPGVDLQQIQYASIINHYMQIDPGQEGENVATPSVYLVCVVQETKDDTGRVVLTIVEQPRAVVADSFEDARKRTLEDYIVTAQEESAPGGSFAAKSADLRARVTGLAVLARAFL